MERLQGNTKKTKANKQNIFHRGESDISKGLAKTCEQSKIKMVYELKSIQWCNVHISVCVI